MTQELDPQTRSYIAVALASGNSQTEVAKELNVTPSNISRHASNPKTKVLIERIQQEIISSRLAVARDNMQLAIDSYPQRASRRQQVEYDAKGRPSTYITDDNGNRLSPDHDLRAMEHGYKLSKSLLQAVGILPSPNQSFLIQRIYNQSNLTLAPVLVQVLQQVIHNSQADAGGMDGMMDDDNLESMPSD